MPNLGRSWWAGRISSKCSFLGVPCTAACRVLQCVGIHAPACSVRVHVLISSLMHATHARAEDSSEKSSDHLSAIALHDLLVGRRVRVFWASDNTWYSGSLGKYSVSSGKHLCQYDDGETEWLNLGREKYELDEGTGIACPSHGHAPGAPCSSIGPVCLQTCRSCIAVHDDERPTLHCWGTAWCVLSFTALGFGNIAYHREQQMKWKCRIV